MKEKVATHMSIMVMAAISVLGYGYRAFVDQDITQYQVQTWLCAYPVVLFMAPFGAFILSKINVEWMLRSIVVLNIGQLTYFNINNPTFAKISWSLVFCALLMALFHWSLSAIVDKAAPRARRAWLWTRDKRDR